MSTELALQVLIIGWAALLVGFTVKWWRFFRARRRLAREQRAADQAASNARALHRLAADARRRPDYPRE